MVGWIDTPCKQQWRSVLPRHPLLVSAAIKEGRGRHAWQPVAEAAEVADSQHCEVAIDLALQGGLRVLVGALHQQRQFIRFQFHHACCDGRGGLTFVEELLREYDSLVRRNTPFKPDADPPTMTPRELVLSWPAAIARNAKDGLRIWRFYARKPLEVHGPPADEAEDPHQYPAFVSHSCTEAQTRDLLRAAQSHGTTLNDLLVRDAYLTIQDWTRSHSDLPRRTTVRLSLPIDMRDARKGERRCENTVSMVFLDRRLAEMAAPDDLLRSISREMQQVKRDRMGVTLLRATRWLRLLPGGMNATLGTKRCLTSTVLSNLGCLVFNPALLRGDGRIKAGDLIVESMDLLPPFRYRTPLVFGVLTYANRLRLALHYNGRLVDVASAQSLLDGFVRQLQISAKASR